MTDDWSLIDAARTQLHDNAGFRTTSSLSMAYLFVEAYERLIGLLPAATNRQEEAIRIDLRTYKDRADKAIKWIASKKARSSRATRYFDTSCNL